MSYPEKGATYRHSPKFMERAKAAEKRADGGSIIDRWKNGPGGEDGEMGGALGKLGVPMGGALGMLGAGGGMGGLLGGALPGGALQAAGIKLKRGGGVDDASEKRTDRPKRSRKC